ncbi:MAG TPA: cysteine peptidase family C39 domain-containing protein [Polyangia bacterium]|nr:cysteine peptidase family C39 domain-containing protein [Polyangia bacterium]
MRREPLWLGLAAIALGACAHARADAPVVAPDGGGWTVVPHVRPLAQTGDADCGPAALATALGRWGLAPGPHAFPHGPTRGDGASAGELRDEARRLGLAAFVIEGKPGDLKAEIDEGHPVVVGLIVVARDARIPHFTVVVGHDAEAQRWLVADPALGVHTIKTGALQEAWARAGWVTLVMGPR